MARSGTKACSRMAHDVKRLADTVASIADGHQIKGGVFGEGNRQVFYEYGCANKSKFGPGPCSVYTIERSGPGVKHLGLRAKDTVGNIHGLTTQISRDIARMWCGAPAPEVGFEGRRLRRKRRP